MSDQELVDMISTTLEATAYYRDHPADTFIAEDINRAVAVIAEQSRVASPPLVKPCDHEIPVLERWLYNLLDYSYSKESAGLPLYAEGIDKPFLKVIRALQKESEESVYSHIMTKFSSLAIENQKQLESYLSRFPFWGSMNIREKDYDALELRANALTSHAGDFLWLYQRLGDYRSRFVLRAFVANWLSFDFELLQKAKEPVYPDYFDPDIILCDENEVFVDLGAYIGDSVADYVNSYGRRFKKIYCYEISPKSFDILKSTIKNNHLERVELRQRGVGDQRGKLYIHEGSDPSANTLSDSGSVEVDIVPLDEDISEPITLLKMDIEGAEQAAIRGCRKHIAEDKPKLALSLYHNNEDIWKIPRMIDEICPGYAFFLRYHGGNLIPTELSLLGVYVGLTQ